MILKVVPLIFKFLFVISIIFYLEYFFVISFLFKILTCKSYIKISPSRCDLFQASWMWIWVEYCRISAFKRVYVLFLRKPPTFTNILVFLVVVLLGVPLRIMRVAFNMLKMSDYGFRVRLEILYEDLLNSLGNTCIEVLDGKILLNCHTRYTLALLLRKVSPRSSNEELLNKWKLVKFHLLDFRNFEEKTGERFKMMGATLRAVAEGKTTSLHYTQNMSIKQFQLDGLIHSTSNVNAQIEINQYPSTALRDQILAKAPNPGTILTLNPFQFTWVGSSNFKMVNEWDLKYSLHNIDKNLLIKIDDVEYFKEKNATIAWALGTDKESRHVKDLCCGLYDVVLNSSSDADMMEALNSTDSQ